MELQFWVFNFREGLDYMFFNISGLKTNKRERHHPLPSISITNNQLIMKTLSNPNLLKNPGNSKRIFYLKSDPDIITNQLDESLIQWIYRFADHQIPTPSLNYLVNMFYSQN